MTAPPKQEHGWGTYYSNLKNATLDDANNVNHDGKEAWPPAFLFGAGGGASPHVLQPWYQQGKVGTLGDSAAILARVARPGGPSATPHSRGVSCPTSPWTPTPTPGC